MQHILQVFKDAIIFVNITNCNIRGLKEDKLEHFFGILVADGCKCADDPLGGVKPRKQV